MERGRRPLRAGLALAAVLLPAPVPARGAEPLPSATRRAAEALRDRALAEGRAAEWARRLTDEVGPRPAGSAGDRAAVAWGVALFRELGFSGVRAEPVPVKVWKRG